MKAVLVTILGFLVACIAPTSSAVCSNDRRGYIKCASMSGTSVLVNALWPFHGRSFEELLIESCSLQYIPHEIFEEIKVKRLYVKSSSLTDLFDEPPKSGTTLEKILLESTSVSRCCPHLPRSIVVVSISSSFSFCPKRK